MRGYKEIIVNSGNIFTSFRTFKVTPGWNLPAKKGLYPNPCPSEHEIHNGALHLHFSVKKFSYQLHSMLPVFYIAADIIGLDLDAHEVVVKRYFVPQRYYAQAVMRNLYLDKRGYLESKDSLTISQVRSLMEEQVA